MNCFKDLYDTMKNHKCKEHHFIKDDAQMFYLKMVFKCTNCNQEWTITFKDFVNFEDNDYKEKIYDLIDWNGQPKPHILYSH